MTEKEKELIVVTAKDLTLKVLDKHTGASSDMAAKTFDELLNRVRDIVLALNP